MGNFTSYENQTALMTAISNKIKEAAGGGDSAFNFRGNSTFANLPEVLTTTMAGYVYNVTDAFTTDSRFVESAGIECEPGTDVIVADMSTYAEVTPEAGDNPSSEGWYEIVDGKYVLSEDTEVESGKTYYAKTVVVKFNLFSTSVDISGIYDMIADEFSTATSYSTGDVVIYNGKLYKFKTDHAAGAWSSADVDEKTVDELISEAEPSSLTTAQVNALIALLN